MLPVKQVVRIGVVSSLLAAVVASFFFVSSFSPVKAQQPVGASDGTSVRIEALGDRIKALEALQLPSRVATIEERLDNLVWMARGTLGGVGLLGVNALINFSKLLGGQVVRRRRSDPVEDGGEEEG